LLIDALLITRYASYDTFYTASLGSILIKKTIVIFVALMSSYAFGAGTDQIKLNAQFVKDRFGPQSGIKNFGCNDESIAYLDGFISRQIAVVNKDSQTFDRFVSLFGSFIGECIVTSYGATWVVKDNDIHIESKIEDFLFITKPFQKVAQRIKVGEEENLLFYYSEVIPVLLGKKLAPKLPDPTPHSSGTLDLP
jgi:hypothetical protein